jgi:hypothetical protein
MFVAPIGLWPWDHDEVATFGELGIIATTRYPEPVAQLERMHKLVPVWHVLQNSVLRVVPHTEWGARLLPSLSGALSVIVAFLAVARLRRPWLAWSLLLLMCGSQTLLWLSQQNRFYSLAMLWTVLSFVCVWADEDRREYEGGAVLFALLAVLSHNITVVLFGLGAVAAVACVVMGRMPRLAARRAALCGVATGILYLMYLRPLIAGWMSGNTGGTQPLVSLVAQIGVVPLALAVVGSGAVFTTQARSGAEWWFVLCLLSLSFVASSPWTVGNWNPRYALFFMIPIWLLAAFGCAAVAEALRARPLALAWFAAVGFMLLPKVASHFVDGSRHDLRTAASIVARGASDAQVLSNWPAELQYYLEPLTGQHAAFWYPGDKLPAGEAVVVIASNAWEPALRVKDRSVTILGDVSRRRFDEQSHVARVYLVGAARDNRWASHDAELRTR